MPTITQEIQQKVYEEVFKKAEKQASLKIARRLLTCLDVVTISEITDLSIEEVQALADEEKKLRVLKISNNHRNMQKNLADIARIFGDDVYNYIVLTQPKLAKSVDYAMGFTDGADMIERRIALRLLNHVSFQQVSQMMDLSIDNLADIANDYAANHPIDLPF
ncbi:MAG: hypothetical protein KDE51_14865 [Anaerolineales bacterium]|nr:hypothetical protein [Anaerolineales bacterium]